MKQLYVIAATEYSSVSVFGVFEGPAGLDITEIAREFNHYWHGEGLPPQEVFPYDGPFKEYKQSRMAGAVCSGAFAATDYYPTIEGKPGVYLVPEVESPEYKAWQKKTEAARRAYWERREARMEELRKKYGGAEQEEVCLNFLLKEHGLRKLDDAVIAYL
jgi:hypothetical protein